MWMTPPLNLARLPDAESSYRRPACTAVKACGQIRRILNTMKGRLLLLLKVLSALAAGSVALAAALYSAEVWKPSKGAITTLLVVAATVTFLSATATAVR